MCLYVCPTGATNTENGIIDMAKCLPGCMECVKSCPGGAISMIPDRYPRQQPKTEAVIAGQRSVGSSKVKQEKIAETIAASTGSAAERQFADAIAKSNLRMAEDILRESGYLLPQSANVRKLLESMLEKAGPDFPKDAAKLLLNKLGKEM